ARLPDEELASRVGVPVAVAPALRGAHTLVEARELARTILDPPDPGGEAVSPGERERVTLERFRELRDGANGALDKDAARAILRELKAVGGDLRTVRRALTGRS